MGNRIIKESICASPTIDGLDWFEEVFFYRLLVNCDDYGRMDARPAILRARLFPLKDIRLDVIAKTVDRLADAGAIYLYTAGDNTYIQVATWSKHQSIRNKKSKYPEPEQILQQDKSNANERKQLNTIEYNCKQLKSNASNRKQLIFQSNPIQSESESNPNPGDDARAREVNPDALDGLLYFEANVAPIVRDTDRDMLLEAIAGYGLEAFKTAVDRTKSAGGRTAKYVLTVLRGRAAARQSKGGRSAAKTQRRSDVAALAQQAGVLQGGKNYEL